MFRESSACKVNWYWSVGNDEPRQRFALRYANFKRKCFIDKVIRVTPLMFAKNVCEPTGATAGQNGCFFGTKLSLPKRSPKTVWRDVFSTFQDNNKRKHKTNFNNKSDKTHLLFFFGFVLLYVFCTRFKCIAHKYIRIPVCVFLPFLFFPCIIVSICFEIISLFDQFVLWYFYPNDSYQWICFLIHFPKTPGIWQFRVKLRHLNQQTGCFATASLLTSHFFDL